MPLSLCTLWNNTPLETTRGTLRGKCLAQCLNLEHSIQSGAQTMRLPCLHRRMFYAMSTNNLRGITSRLRALTFESIIHSACILPLVLLSSWHDVHVLCTFTVKHCTATFTFTVYVYNVRLTSRPFSWLYIYTFQ